MEHEIMLTGVGGQGIQLASQVLARAAVLEGRQVMSLGVYGGTMRGGNTDSTLVVADAPINSPPIVSRVSAVLAMHHAFFEPIQKKLRPKALVILNSTVFETKIDSTDVQLFEIPATRIAADLGNGMAASLVLISAYANLTGLVSLPSLVEAMEQSVPSYRRQHVEGNALALQSGYVGIGANIAPAWPESGEGS
jgi:2-oxoacid:acceptor oxidoreductase gamma subunit (pyruvate/2-ketoisovalerate family)